MSLKSLDEAREVVRKHFGFLFERGANFIFSDYHAHAFGNFVIVLETDDLRIRFARDRGTMTIGVGTLEATPGWEGEWYDLICVVAFLTKKQVLITGYWDYRFDDEKQLDRLAKVLRFYYTQIAELFEGDVFQKNKAALDLVSEDFQSLIFEPRRRNEEQKLLAQSVKFWQELDRLEMKPSGSSSAMPD